MIHNRTLVLPNIDILLPRCLFISMFIIIGCNIYTLYSIKLDINDVVLQNNIIINQILDISCKITDSLTYKTIHDKMDRVRQYNEIIVDETIVDETIVDETIVDETIVDETIINLQNSNKNTKLNWVKTIFG